MSLSSFPLNFLHRARHDERDIQLSSEGGVVRPVLLETKDGTERPNLEIGTAYLAETVDDVYRESRAKQIRLRVVPSVPERQDGDRMNALVPLSGLVGKPDAPQQVDIAGFGMQVRVCRLDF